MTKNLQATIDSYKKRLKEIDEMFFAIAPKLQQVLTKGNFQRLQNEKEEHFCKVLAITYVLSLSISYDNKTTLDTEKCKECEMQLDEYKKFIEKIKTRYLDLDDKTPPPPPPQKTR